MFGVEIAPSTEKNETDLKNLSIGEGSEKKGHGSHLKFFLEGIVNGNVEKLKMLHDLEADKREDEKGEKMKKICC